MTEPIAAGADARLDLCRAWTGRAGAAWGADPETFEPASADASFRRYFRVQAEDRTLIVMDAPPEKESVSAFCRVDALMREAGVHAPEILAADEQQGFLLMEDLGRQTYLDVLNEDNAFELFQKAVDALVAWQKASRPGVLPEYGQEKLRAELDLFPQWYVSRHRGHAMDDKETKILGKVFARILENNLAQPKVFVHRDYMPRNLMVSDPCPGVIDFQDALYGPVSYDIASLLRDAFISWGEEFVIDATVRYWDKARRAGLPVPGDFGTFWRDVEWMGLQRHLKVLGIFARINYRDGKPKYLADTPRFLRYVRQTANRYDELKALNWLLDRFEEEKMQEVFSY